MAATEDVRQLRGVVGIFDQIPIRPSADIAHIHEQIAHALKRSWSDPDRTKMSSNGGAIRLTGTARSPVDRELAVATAWSAPGATSVENDIATEL
jgi:osmotically-inducible protein OsmY